MDRWLMTLVMRDLVFCRAWAGDAGRGIRALGPLGPEADGNSGRQRDGEEELHRTMYVQMSTSSMTHSLLRSCFLNGQNHQMTKSLI